MHVRVLNNIIEDAQKGYQGDNGPSTYELMESLHEAESNNEYYFW